MKEKEVFLFFKDKNQKDGLFIWCKDCKKRSVKISYIKHKDARIKKSREYNKKNKEKRKKYYDVQRAKNPLRTKSVAAFNYFIRCGKIIRKPCVVCGSEKSQGHHEDYNKPFDVIWLCSYHHKETHGRILVIK